MCQPITAQMTSNWIDQRVFAPAEHVDDNALPLLVADFIDAVLLARAPISGSPRPRSLEPTRASASSGDNWHRSISFCSCSEMVADEALASLRKTDG